MMNVGNVHNMGLQTLPAEILSEIIEQLLATIGPFKAVNIRLVSSESHFGSSSSIFCSDQRLTCNVEWFDAAILAALTTRQAIDFEDPALFAGHL